MHYVHKHLHRQSINKNTKKGKTKRKYSLWFSRGDKVKLQQKEYFKCSSVFLPLSMDLLSDVNRSTENEVLRVLKMEICHAAPCRVTEKHQHSSGERIVREPGRFLWERMVKAQSVVRKLGFWTSNNFNGYGLQVFSQGPLRTAI